jgi:peptidoglycan hydrolase-like protein with peptidoglycan-binding domain
VRGRGRTRRVSAPSYQTHPDPERYQQIQQALADKGYYKGDVNGQWNDDSSDALKRFQADQKLDSDGKINALTLRGLGLGPKHDGSTAPMSGAAAAAKTSTAPAIPEPPPIPAEAPPEPPE